MKGFYEFCSGHDFDVEMGSEYGSVICRIHGVPNVNHVDLVDDGISRMIIARFPRADGELEEVVLSVPGEEALALQRNAIALLRMFVLTEESSDVWHYGRYMSSYTPMARQDTRFSRSNRKPLCDEEIKTRLVKKEGRDA